MRIVAGLVAAVLLLVAVGALALVAGAALSGMSVMQPAGAIWFKLDSGSLNLLQAAIERGVWPPLWHGIVLPILRVPALVLTAVAGAAGLLTGLLTLRGNGRRRIFHR